MTQCVCPPCHCHESADKKTVPGEILDLTNWYVTLPTGKEGHPVTVKNPEILKYSDANFKVNETGDGVVFTGPCDGVTTVNSHYPRSELRETKGKDLAAWSISKGSHNMTFTGCVTNLPVYKPEVVIGQIHDAEDDVLMIKCSGSTIVVMFMGKTVKVADEDYKLGDKYTIKIFAEKGTISVYYNDMTKPVYTTKAKSSNTDNYFKVGCYTQSNPTKGKSKPGEYGQTVVFAASVKHT